MGTAIQKKKKTVLLKKSFRLFETPVHINAQALVRGGGVQTALQGLAPGLAAGWAPPPTHMHPTGSYIMAVFYRKGLIWTLDLEPSHLSWHPWPGPVSGMSTLV